jgi:hypothetical protein
MAMHNNFADWYRAASITPSTELLAARWEGVEELAVHLDTEEIVILLKLYVSKPVPGFQAPDWMDKAFREQDTTFPSRDNVEELRVLAGAILRQAIEVDGPISVAIALGLVSSTFGNRVQQIPSNEHVDAARKYLATKADAMRSADAQPVVRVANPATERREALMPAAVFAANPPLALREPIVNAFNEQTNNTNTALSALSAALWRVNQMQREELDMLWWLQSQVSRDLGKPFADLENGVGQIILPLELSDLTVFLPGSVAIPGLLMAALRLAPSGKDEISIAQAINAVPASWREKRVAEMPLPVAAPSVCPLTLALHRSLDTDAPTDWLPVYRKQSDVSIEVHASPLSVAYALYTEALFLRALVGIQK